MASDLVVRVTETNFETEVLRAPVPVLVDFWAEWCGPCRMLAPLLDELAAEYDGQVKIGKLNVDENTRLAAEYRITGIPTLLLFKDGQVQDVLVGFKNRRDLQSSLERVLTPA